MVSNFLINIIVNTLIFSFLFWLITFLLKYFYSNKYFKNKYNYYECGFKSLTINQIKYSVNYILVILFLIIYDGEFLILIPFSLNSSENDIFGFFLTIFFNETL